MIFIHENIPSLGGKSILKYLFVVANSTCFYRINKHTISLWLYKNPRRSRRVVTCFCQSISWSSAVEVRGCVRCRHLVRAWLVRMSLGTHFQILLSPGESTLFPSGVRQNARKGIEHVHRRMRWKFPALRVRLFFVFRFQLNLLFDK